MAGESLPKQLLKTEKAACLFQNMNHNKMASTGKPHYLVLKSFSVCPYLFVFVLVCECAMWLFITGASLGCICSSGARQHTQRDRLWDLQSPWWMAYLPYNVYPHVIPPTQLLLTHVPLGFFGTKHTLNSKPGTIPDLSLTLDTSFTDAKAIKVIKSLDVMLH